MTVKNCVSVADKIVTRYTAIAGRKGARSIRDNGAYSTGSWLKHKEQSKVFQRYPYGQRQKSIVPEIDPE